MFLKTTKLFFKSPGNIMYSSVALCLTNLFFVTKYTWDKEMHVRITESGHV